MADEDVMVRFGAAVGGMAAGVNRAVELIHSVNESVNSLNERFVHLGEVIGVALSVEGIKHFVESMAELGDTTVHKADELGVPAEKIGELSGIAKLTGTSLDVLAHSFERMTLMVQRSGDRAFSPAAEGLRAIGINAKDLIGLPTDQYFEKLAAAVSKFNPSLNLTNSLMAVGGRGIVALIPALMKGAEGFKEMQEAVIKTGATMTDVQARAFSDTSDKLTLLKLSFEGLGIKIFGVVKPAVDALTESFAHWIQSFSVSAMRDAINAIAISLVNFGASVTRFFISAQESWEKLISSIQSGMPAIHLAAAGLYALGGQFTEMKAAFQAFKDSKPGEEFWVIEANAMNASRAVEAYAQKLRDAINIKIPESGGFAAQVADAEILSKELALIAEQYIKLNAQPLPKPPTADIRNLQAQIKMAQEAYAAETKLADAQFSQTKERLDAKLKQHQLTYSQESDAQIAALDTQYAAQVQALDKMQAVESAKLAAITAKYPEMTNEWKDARNKQAEADQKYFDKVIEGEAAWRTKHNKLVDDMTTHDVETWTKAADAISGAFNSQLKGLIDGTETFKTAMTKMSSDIVMKLIEDQVKLSAVQLSIWLKDLASYVAVQAGMTTASTTGAAVRAAGEMAAGNVSILSTIANAIKAIFASGAQTGAEVTAQVAPVAGPAAPAIGLAAAAATIDPALAMLAMAGSAEVGGYVVSGGLVNVHSGENIVPAQMNQPYSGGNSGVSPTFNVSAIDASSVQSFFNKNARQIASILTSHMNANPSYSGG